MDRSEGKHLRILDCFVPIDDKIMYKYEIQVNIKKTPQV